MAFSWSTIEVGTAMTKNQINEAVQNIKAVENKLQLGTLKKSDGTKAPGNKFSWGTGYDPFTLDSIALPTATIIRNAVDNIQNNNYCRAHDGAYLAGHNGTNYPTQKNPHYTPDLGGYNNSANSSNNGGSY